MVRQVIDLTSHWEAGTIKVALAMLPEAMADGAEKGANDAASMMVTMAKIYVRVDTGTLQKTIRKERGGRGTHWRVISVRAGGYFVNPKTGKLCDYAAIVEEKYPYMTPAYATVEKFLAQQIASGVLEAVP